MFDLIPLDGFSPILKEMARVLKPGGKLVLVNMSKPDGPKIFYEKIYEKGWALIPCPPVLMGPFLEPNGFTDIQKFYRPQLTVRLSPCYGARRSSLPTKPQNHVDRASKNRMRVYMQAISC